MAVLKIARFWPFSKQAPRRPAFVDVDDAPGLDAFGSESSASDGITSPFPSTRTVRTPAAGKGSPQALKLAAAALLTLALAGLAGYEYWRHPLPWIASTGSVTFDTVPSGIEVFVRGKSIGRSPVTLALAPGTYEIRLGDGKPERLSTVTVTARTSMVQHYELAPATAVSAATAGALRVQTEPAGLPVSLDGVAKGPSPVTLESVSPGAHDVVVSGRQGPLQRTVHVVAGETGLVFISSPAAASDAPGTGAGWLSFRCVVSLQVREGGRLLGTTDVDKLMLPAGEHELELSNDTAGYQATRRVRIAAGKMTTSVIDVPNGTLSLNALPWAEVYVDGKSLGQTPMGNVSLPIGPHAILFRHPELGERKETVNVTTRSTTRLGVDLRKK